MNIALDTSFKLGNFSHVLPNYKRLQQQTTWHVSCATLYGDGLSMCTLRWNGLFTRRIQARRSLVHNDGTAHRYRLQTMVILWSSSKLAKQNHQMGRQFQHRPLELSTYKCNLKMCSCKEPILAQVVFF